MTRSTFLPLALLLLAVSILAPRGLAAQEKEDFTDARFAELQARDALILVDIWADWCPTCAEQQRVLKAFQEENPDAEFHILQVNFDTQKPVVTRFAAPRQSTLILYRGEERLWFSVAETRRDAIFTRLSDALAEPGTPGAEGLEGPEGLERGPGAVLPR
jgi:thioredoxin 1